MRTSVLQVHDMLSVFSVDDAEKRIGEVPGVESVTVNFAAGNATVRFDETRLEIADIKSAVRRRGFEPAAAVDEPPGEEHEGHAASGASPAVAVTPASSSTPIAPTTAGATKPDSAASSATPDPASAETPAAPAAAEDDSSKDPAEPVKG
ncbi:MAG: cation transporter [Polaromonas sp.]